MRALRQHASALNLAEMGVGTARRGLALLAVAVVIYGVDFRTATPVAADSSTSAPSCDYYASPTGAASNNGLTPQTPFRPQDFWARATPGKILCLMDGTYRGDSFMLAPHRQGQREPVGTPTSPITVRALNDGQVLIDGQGTRDPVSLGFTPVRWLVLEGFNACCGASGNGADTIGITAEDTTLRRIVAWDTRDYPDNSGSSHVINLVNSKRVLLEDVAAFGRGRKMFQIIGDRADGNICRRCWGRWEGYDSVMSQPRVTMQPSYGASNTTLENNLMTWSAEVRPNSPCVKGACPNYYGVMMVDQGKPPQLPRSTTKILGSVAYLKQDAATFYPPAPWVDSGVGFAGVTTILQDVIAVIEPGTRWTGKQGFLFPHKNPGTNSITRASTWGGAGNDISSGDWKQTNVCVSRTFPGSCPNPYTGTNGANVCKRYVNGAMTTEPLWPWPMDQRIRAALTSAGRRTLAGPDGTVTSEIETLLGSIPAVCRADGPGR